MSSDEVPLVVEEMAEAPSRPFNPRAFKVVCVTLLTCLLLACLAFTLCTLYEQRQQIDGLQKTSQEMDKQLERWKMDSVKERRAPMQRLPMLDFHFSDFFATTEAPKEPWNWKEDESLENLQKDLDKFTETSRMNLQDLRNQMKRSDWKSLKAWMKNWVTFQKAQQPKQQVTTTTEAPVLNSKCLEEARNASALVGAFRPHCDNSGRYKPVQCWPATRLCWCVDQTGTAINGTTMIGRPRCQKPSYPGSGLRQ